MTDPAGEDATTERGTLLSDGFELAYSVEGSGRPALVIGSAVYYPRTFSAELRRSLRMAFIDHRGFTRPDPSRTKDDFALETVLQDAERLRRHLGLEQVVVIGHSGNGYLALEYAKRYPDHVTHVVLIATGPSQSAEMHALTERHWSDAVCPERKARQEAELRHLGAELDTAPERRFITFCVRLGPRSWYDPEFDAAPLWEGVAVNMTGIDYLWGEVFRDIDVTDGLDRLRAPVFLALGRFDYLVAPYFAWEPYRPRFANLTVRVFDRSAHTPQLEERRLFDQELLQWLSSARPAP